MELYRELESRFEHKKAYEDASAAAQAAARILERLVTADRLRFEPRLAHTLHRLAGLGAMLGRCQEALAAADGALAIYEKYSQARAVGLDEARASLELIHGDALTALERPTEAARALERAETLYQRLTANGATALRPALASAQQRHGTVLVALGRHEEAHAPLTQALALYEALAVSSGSTYDNRVVDMQSGVLRSFVAPTSLRYRGWSSAKATNPGDKPVLQQALEGEYPGGVDGVDALLIQSSLQTDRSVLSSPAYSGEAAQLVIASIDRWLEI